MPKTVKCRFWRFHNRTVCNFRHAMYLHGVRLKKIRSVRRSPYQLTDVCENLFVCSQEAPVGSVEEAPVGKAPYGQQKESSVGSVLTLMVRSVPSPHQSLHQSLHQRVHVLLAVLGRVHVIYRISNRVHAIWTG